MRALPLSMILFLHFYITQSACGARREHARRGVRSRGQSVPIFSAREITFPFISTLASCVGVLHHRVSVTRDAHRRADRRMECAS